MPDPVDNFTDLIEQATLHTAEYAAALVALAVLWVVSVIALRYLAKIINAS